MKVKEKMIGGVAMTQNLTYTRCGDYLIPDVRLSYKNSVQDERAAINEIDVQRVSGSFP